MAHPVGRPRLIESPDEMIRLATAYFTECEKNKTYPKITDLVLALGLASLQSLAEYEARPEFSDIVKRLRLIVASGYEDRLGTTTPAGAIFALKNMGWTDRQDLALSTPDGPVRIDPGRDKLTDEQLSTLITLAETAKSTTK